VRSYVIVGLRDAAAFSTTVAVDGTEGVFGGAGVVVVGVAVEVGETVVVVANAVADSTSAAASRATTNA
jgi:hypothetical protein